MTNKNSNDPAIVDDGWVALRPEEAAGLQVIAAGRENLALRQRVLDLEEQQFNLLLCGRIQVPYGMLEVDLAVGRVRPRVGRSSGAKE